MRNTIKFLGNLNRASRRLASRMKIRAVPLLIIALTTLIAFSSCSNGSTGGGGRSSGGGSGGTTTGGASTIPNTVTYTGQSNGSKYTLKITENTARAVYTPKNGDNYELTVSNKKSNGSVVAFTNRVFTLKPSNSGTTFNATILGSDLLGMTGTITWTDNQTTTGPGTLTLPTPPTNIKGNLGNYEFGIETDGVSTNYYSAVWSLTGTNLTLAKTTAGARLVLELSATPSEFMLLAWQGLGNDNWEDNIWWKSKAIYEVSFVSGTGVTWNSGTKTLTIPLSPSSVDDYDSFLIQPSINLIILYSGHGGVNDLGIVSANLFGPAPPPTNITGNLGNYKFGYAEDGVSTNYYTAVWSLTGTNLTTAKTAGAKLVLGLSAAPSGLLTLNWQGPDNAIWWKWKVIYEEETGSLVSTTGVTWNSGTKTLTFPLASSVDDYSSFITQPSINLIILYGGQGGGVNDLGIVSANLVP